jgi:hypothetical protein
MQKVYVVIAPDLGWDSVVGVFCSTIENLEKVFADDRYIIQEYTVETSTEDWE